MSGWGVVFSVMASELDVSVKLRLNPTELRAAHAIIGAMGNASYSSADINAVCRAMFLYSVQEDFLQVWRLFCEKLGTNGLAELRAEDAKDVISLISGGLDDEAKVAAMRQELDDRVVGVSFDDFVALLVGLNPCGRQLQKAPKYGAALEKEDPEEEEEESAGSGATVHAAEQRNNKEPPGAEEEEPVFPKATRQDFNSHATAILNQLEKDLRLTKTVLPSGIYSQLSEEDVWQCDRIIPKLQAETYRSGFSEYRLFSDEEVVTIICALYLASEDHFRSAWALFDTTHRRLIDADDLLVTLPLLRSGKMPAGMIEGVESALKNEAVDYPTFVAVLQYVSHKDFGRIDIADVKHRGMLGLVDYRTRNKQKEDEENWLQQLETRVHKTHKPQYISHAHDMFKDLAERKKQIEAKLNEAEEIAQFEHLQQTISLKGKSLLQRRLDQARRAKEGNTSEQDTLAKNIASATEASVPMVKELTTTLLKLSLQEVERQDLEHKIGNAEARVHQLTHRQEEEEEEQAEALDQSLDERRARAERHLETCKFDLGRGNIELKKRQREQTTLQKKGLRMPRDTVSDGNIFQLQEEVERAERLVSEASREVRRCKDAVEEAEDAIRRLQRASDGLLNQLEDGMEHHDLQTRRAMSELEGHRVELQRFDAETAQPVDQEDTIRVDKLNRNAFFTYVNKVNETVNANLRMREAEREAKIGAHSRIAIILFIALGGSSQSGLTAAHETRERKRREKEEDERKRQEEAEVAAEAAKAREKRKQEKARARAEAAAAVAKLAVDIESGIVVQGDAGQDDVDVSAEQRQQQRQDHDASSQAIEHSSEDEDEDEDDSSEYTETEAETEMDPERAFFTSEKIQAANSMFEFCDTDGSNAIDADEFLVLLEMLDPEVTKKHVIETMLEYATNKDDSMNRQDWLKWIFHTFKGYPDGEFYETMDLLAEAYEDLQDEMDEGEEEGVEEGEHEAEDDRGQDDSSNEAEEDVRLPVFGGPKAASSEVEEAGEAEETDRNEASIEMRTRRTLEQTVFAKEGETSAELIQAASSKPVYNATRRNAPQIFSHPSLLSIQSCLPCLTLCCVCVPCAEMDEETEPHEIPTRTRRTLEEAVFTEEKKKKIETRPTLTRKQKLDAAKNKDAEAKRVVDEAVAKKQAAARAAELAALAAAEAAAEEEERRELATQREEAQQQRKKTSERKKKRREEKAKAALSTATPEELVAVAAAAAVTKKAEEDTVAAQNAKEDAEAGARAKEQKARAKREIEKARSGELMRKMAEEHAARKKKAYWSENRLREAERLYQHLCMTNPSRNYQTIAIDGFAVVIDSLDDDDEDTTEADVVRMLQLPADAVGIDNEQLNRWIYDMFADMPEADFTNVVDALTMDSDEEGFEDDDEHDDEEP